VDYFCAQAVASGCDAVVGLALHRQVLAAYPGMHRTALRFRDAAYCGCNLFALLTPAGRAVATFWQRVEQQRKRPWRLLGALGWGAVVRYLLGRLTLAEALDLLSQRLHLRLGVVLLPFPQAAVDVDSVADWRFAEQLAARLPAVTPPGHPSSIPGPQLVQIGERLVACPTAPSKERPMLDVGELIAQERDRWPW
jgi:hypothetical protein